MAISPIVDTAESMTFSMLIDGKHLPDDCLVESVTINQTVNAKDTAVITLIDGGLTEGTFEIPGSDTFKLFAGTSIKLGYGTSTETVFNGIVTGHQVKINPAGSTLTITCKTKEVRPLVFNPSTVPPAILKLSYGIDIIEAELEIDVEQAASVLSKFRGFVRFPGSVLAMVNTMMQVEGFGNLFYEDVFISGVEHMVKDGNWITRAQIGVLPG